MRRLRTRRVGGHGACLLQACAGLLEGQFDRHGDSKTLPAPELQGCGEGTLYTFVVPA